LQGEKAMQTYTTLFYFPTMKVDVWWIWTGPASVVPKWNKITSHSKCWVSDCRI